MLRTADYFEDQELTLVYIAKKLKESLALEKILTDANVDYLIETDTYLGGLIFRSARVGAFFYVQQEVEAPAKQLLSDNGYKAFEPFA